MYSYVSTGKDGKAKMADSAKKGREKRALQEDKKKDKKAPKSAEPAKKGTKEYYQEKEAASMREYDELKEAVYRNKNVRSATVLDMITEGIDVAGNIASFFPGIGTLVQLGATATGAGIKAGHSLGSALYRGVKNLVGADRSDKHKKQFRSKYAQDIYSRMAQVAEYVDETGSWDFSKLNEETIKRVDENYSFAEDMIEGLGSGTSDLIKAKNKNDLLDTLSGSFARGE